MAAIRSIRNKSRFMNNLLRYVLWSVVSFVPGERILEILVDQIFDLLPFLLNSGRATLSFAIRARGPFSISVG
jgi:hypothetical protein